MGRVRSKGTAPELAVRRVLRELGIGYRIHVRSLPGTPDIACLGRRKVVFVNGCFWHQHPGCRRSSLPKTNTAFWEAKLHRNTSRDESTRARLEALGWRALVVWECEIHEPALRETLARFLSTHDEPHDGVPT